MGKRSGENVFNKYCNALSCQHDFKCVVKTVWTHESFLGFSAKLKTTVIIIILDVKSERWRHTKSNCLPHHWVNQSSVLFCGWTIRTIASWCRRATRILNQRWRTTNRLQHIWSKLVPQRCHLMKKLLTLLRSNRITSISHISAKNILLLCAQTCRWLYKLHSQSFK